MGFEISMKFLMKWVVTQPILINLLSQHIFSIVAADYEQIREGKFL